MVEDDSQGGAKVCVLLGFMQIHGQSLLCTTTVVNCDKGYSCTVRTLVIASCNLRSAYDFGVSLNRFRM